MAKGRVSPVAARWPSFALSRWALLPLAVAAAAASAVWGRTWFVETFGYGLAIIAVLVLALAACWRFSPRLLLRHWHRWLGAALLGVAAWTLLALFHAQSGPLERESLGGQLGQALLTGNKLVGVLLASAYTLVAYCLLTPALALRSSRWAGLRVGGAAAGAGALLFRRLAAVLKRGPLRSAPLKKGRRPPTVIILPGAAGAGPQAPGGPLYDAEAVYPEVPKAPEAAVNGPFKGLWNRIRKSNHKVAEEKPPTHPAAPQGTVTLEPLSPRAKANGWRLPPREILDEVPESRVSEEENQRRSQKIEEALASFGIPVKVVETNPGPTVTQFGVEPGWLRKYKEVKERDSYGRTKLDKHGNPVVRLAEVSKSRVKVDSILALEKDLALALAAVIRFEAPVPGKSVVGIEVPNAKIGMVGLREVVESPQFERLHSKHRLAMALGKGTGGDPAVFDLTKMPHLLMAGATGSGKSVSLASMLCCLLMHFTPEELRLILVDPKRVELTGFNGVPHLLTPVVTETDKTVAVLRWLNQEMDVRYKTFQVVGARNIEGYNRQSKSKGTLPYLVIVVDELADLMASAPVDVEHALTRLAQLGRAAGIHLIVATQRPSVDVITGLIKANFPARLSFNVSSVVDSRTVLDGGGAEKLLGRGDMLFLPPDAPKPRRLQGCYVSDKEEERLAKWWRDQRVDQQPAQLSDQEIMSAVEGPEGAKKDPLLEKARQMAHTHSKVSTSLLQRKLGVGYPRAARLMEILEEEGLIASRSESRETVARLESGGTEEDGGG